MRQVMPHRNNIVARLGRCKSFLRPVSDCPVNWRRCGIPVRSCWKQRKHELCFHINGIKRHTPGEARPDYHELG
jgi:hypothetical protein